MQERGERYKVRCRENRRKNRKRKGSARKRKPHAWIRRTAVLVLMIFLILLSARLLSVYLKGMEQEKRERQVMEGRQLCMAVSALFRENMENTAEKEGMSEECVLDFVMDIYWRDIGDISHPLYGSCPSTWDAEGKITGITINEAGDLLEITYEDPDGKEEVWKMHQENGELTVEVVEN